MTPIKCWEGSGGSLHRSPCSAAASIIKAASDFDLREAIEDNHPPHERHKELRKALVWVGEYIRKKKQPQ